jgi:hypothetical protein
MKPSSVVKLLVVALAAAQTGLATARDEPFIAGTTPSQRPVGAPVIVDVQRDAEWYRRALTGISTPYPASLRFLEDQGNWYTPFTRPGMLPPYDIRGWHVD